MAKKERKTKEKPSKTVRDYRKWRNVHVALKATEYAAPFVPFGVTLGVNWGSFFPETGGNHTSVGIGLVLAVASLAMSVLAVSKKDTDFMKKIGPIIPIAFAFIAWGVVCILLSTVLMELGKALASTGAGLIASAVADTVDNAYVGERYGFLRNLTDENGLSKKGKWQQQARIQAQIDAEREAVQFVPHD